MFPSSMIIAGGKRRHDVNATAAMDPSPHHIQLWPHVRASAVFSEGAKSAGGSTFWHPWHDIWTSCETSKVHSLSINNWPLRS